MGAANLQEKVIHIYLSFAIARNETVVMAFTENGTSAAKRIYGPATPILQTEIDNASSIALCQSCAAGIDQISTQQGML
jgi:hypothetical protein